jgi:hypothetical protein
MRINNSLDVARWESIPCKCGKDVMDSFPIKECLHCCFDERFQSIPKEDFKINADEYDKNGKLTKKQNKMIKEVTLIRGSRYQDVIGWTF